MVSGKSNTILRNSLTIFGRLVVVIIICNFICLSFQTVATSLFTEVRGYQIYGYKGDDAADAEFLYEHYNADGDDTKYLEYEADGYTLQKRSIRTQMFPVGRAVSLILSQAVCFITLFGFIYHFSWKSGDRDGSAIRFGRMKADNLKGFKFGLLASLPLILIYIAFLIFGNNVPVGVYTLFNAHLYSVLELVYGSASLFGELSVIRLIVIGLLLLFVPIVVGFGYIIGVKGILISKKIIYQENGED